MRRARKRGFSLRERRMIDGFIKEICRTERLPLNDPQLFQCGWEAFLSVYRDAPEGFSHDGTKGWRRAYLIIRDALLQERRAMEFFLYHVDSLDKPVNEEIEISRMELLEQPHGDFQNSVCFYDFLNRLDVDVCRMA